MGKDLLAVLLEWGVSDTLFGLANAQQFWKIFFDLMLPRRKMVANVLEEENQL